MTRRGLPVLLAVFLVACASASNDVAASDPEPPPGSSPSTRPEPVGSTTSVETGSTPTTPGSASPYIPCDLFSRGELEAAVGFSLADGMHSDLSGQGIDGRTCFLEGPSLASVSVTIVTGDQAGVFFDAEIPDGGGFIDGVGDRTHVAVNEGQSNVRVLHGQLLVLIDVIQGGSIWPGDFDERLADLARTAVSRLG